MSKKLTLAIVAATVLAASVPVQDSPFPTCGPCSSTNHYVPMTPVDPPTPTCGPCLS